MGSNMQMKRILVPVKGDIADDEAIHLAYNIARDSKETVYVLYVIEIPRNLPLDAEIPEETTKGEEVLLRMEEVAKAYKCTVEAEILQARDVGPAIVQEAIEREVHMIVIGVPHDTQFGSFSLGATVPYVLQHAPCRVLVWRGEAPANGVLGRII